MEAQVHLWIMRRGCSFVFCTDFSFILKKMYRMQTFLNNFKTANITCDVQEKCRLVVTISTSDCLFWPREKNLFEAFSVHRA